MSHSKDYLDREHIDISDPVYSSYQGSRAGAKYGKLSESLRHAIPEATTCSLFCGGKKCKYCSSAQWKEEQMAIKGLYSSWVTDNILATARPSKEAIEQFDAIKQFNAKGIKSIINLQTPGEHASCGNALHESGFSYDPQEFMDKGVFFYNFGWPDYNVGSLANILDMVKVTEFALSEGKIAVHCHAGLGRTGVLIAAYLVYANRMDPHDAIHYIRSKRPGAIQTRTQVQCVEEFASYLKPLRIVFTDVVFSLSNTQSVDNKPTAAVVCPGGCGSTKVHPQSPPTQPSNESPEFTLSQFLRRQQHLLHGYEARELKHLPKIVFITCERLLQLAEKGRPLEGHQDSFEIMKMTSPSAFNNVPESQKSKPALRPSRSSLDVTKPAAKSRSMGNMDRVGNKEQEEDEMTDEERQLMKNAPVIKAHTTAAEWVAQCMVTLEHKDHAEGDTIKNIVMMHKKKLNKDDQYFKTIEEETHPTVLAMLLFDWLDSLKEPVLGSQDLPQMLMNYMDNPLQGLNKLGRGARVTTEYLMRMLVRLSPITDATMRELLQRLLSVLTHQHVDISSMDVTMGTQSPTTLMRRTTNSSIMSASQLPSIMRYSAVLLDQIKDKMDQEKSKQKNS